MALEQSKIYKTYSRRIIHIQKNYRVLMRGKKSKYTNKNFIIGFEKIN